MSFNKTACCACMLLLCGLFAAAGFLFAQTAPVSAADERKFQEAQSALSGGDFARAASILQELRLQHLHNYQIDELLGLAYASQNRLNDAIPFLVAAVREQPKSDAAHANLGSAYLKSGRAFDAAREFLAATSLNPRNLQAQEELGQAWMILRQPQKAIVAFSAAMGSGSPSPDLLYNYALAYFQTKNSVKAEALLSRMPGLETSAEAQSLYGDVEENLGRYKEAAQHFARAAQLAPTEANVYALGLDFLRHWSFDPAIKEFGAGVNAFPQSRRMRLALGVSYYGNDNYNRAIGIFADLLHDDPENATVAELLGRTCALLSEGDDSRCAALLDFAEKHPQNAIVATYAAISVLHRSSEVGRLALANRLLRAAVHADPHMPEAHYETGLLLQMQDQWRESIPELDAAIRNKPDYSQAHYRLALAYSRTGQKQEANREVALQQKYSKQEHKDLDARLNQVTTLLISMK